MPRNFNWAMLSSDGERGPRFWLRVTGIVLAALNGAALLFYFVPPGGSREELFHQVHLLESQIAAARTQTIRLNKVAQKVQVGNGQSTDFESKYFLPKRVAYEDVIAELQRMADAAGLQARDEVFNEEPIEGADDLSVLNIGTRYEGSYANLMRFLDEADKSPMLLMLDSLQASPQQRNNQITSEIRFQAVVQQPADSATGERQ